MSESHTLGRKREIRARAWRGKNGLHSEGRHISRRRRRASKKNLPRRDSLEGPHEEAEIQCKALRRWSNLAISKDTCLEKKRVWSKVTPRKVGLGLKRSQERRLS